jgi:hypothetical protein
MFLSYIGDTCLWRPVLKHNEEGKKICQLCFLSYIGDTCSWKPVLRDNEEGKKGYSYFWMEKSVDKEKQALKSQESS